MAGQINLSICTYSICILAIILVVSILVLYVAKNVIQAFQVYVLVSRFPSSDF